MGFEELLGVNPWTALFTLANTIAVFVVAKKFLWVPVLNMIQERQKEIDDLYADAGKAKEEAAALESEYKQKLSAAQATSERMVKEAVARGQNREEEIIRQANREASAIMDKAAADIEQEKKKALNEAKDEIAEMAMAIAGKVVGRELNNEDQGKLIDHFIDELGGEA